MASLSGDPEALFCAMLQAQYQIIVSTLETIIQAPIQVLQLLKSAIQMVEYVAFVAIDVILTKIENTISEMFGLEDVNLEKARRNFCKIAYECKMLTNYLFGPSSPLSALGISQADLTEMKSNYSKFEEIVCNKSFKDMLNEFKTSILGDVAKILDEAEQKITNDWLKIDKLIAKYNDILEDSGVYEWLDKLNDFAECAFAACNVIATSENKQEDMAEKMKLSNTGDAWIIDPNLFSKALAKKEEMQNRIDQLRSRMTACSNDEPNPDNGIKIENIV